MNKPVVLVAAILALALAAGGRITIGTTSAALTVGKPEKAESPATHPALARELKVTQAPPEVMERFGLTPEEKRPSLSEVYEQGAKMRAELAKRLGAICDKVKAGYEKEKYPLHRMDNYWRCLQVQNFSLSPEGHILKWVERQ